MARSYDHRRFPAGPEYTPEGGRVFRGRRRYGDLGRVLPGDEKENTRDHERIWWKLNALLKENARLRRLLTRPDGFRPRNWTDFVAAFVGSEPWKGIRTKVQTSAHVTTSSGLEAIPEANFPRVQLGNYREYYMAGWRVAVRLVGTSNGPHIAASVVSGDGTSDHFGPENFFSGTGIEHPGGNFDTGWLVIGEGEANTDPGEEFEDAEVVISHNYSLGVNSSISGCTVYVQWLQDNEALPTVGDGDIDRGVDGSKILKRAITKTANYTLTQDDDFVLVNASSGAVEIMLPNMSDVVSLWNGQTYTIKRIDSTLANAVTVVRNTNGGMTIDGGTSLSLSVQYECVEIIGDGLDWHIVSWYP